ncbi:MAG: ABC transporter substrate-binding protein [Burkholderiales bacterium]
MKIIQTFLLALVLSVPAAGAAELGPDALVRQITDDVMNAILQDKALQAGDKEKALALAEQKILPHIDFRAMTQLALGRNWSKATPEQQEQVVNGFRSMLIRTYSNAIGAYKGQKMEVKPTRMDPGDTDVTVRNSYLSPGRPAVEVDYRMEKTPAGWKIYDIVFDGVSLVATYRSEFAQQVRAGGIEGLIARLDQKNDAAASK